MVRRSENCTIRLIVLRDGGSGAARQSVINAFHELGVCGEDIERCCMAALDVPPTADLSKVQRLLKHGVAKECGTWKRAALPPNGEPYLLADAIHEPPWAGPSLGRPRLLNSGQ